METNNITAVLKKDGEPCGSRQFYTVEGCIIIDTISVVQPLHNGDIINVYCHATDRKTGKKYDRKHGICYDGISLKSSVEKGEQELRDYYDEHTHLDLKWRDLEPCNHF